MGRVHTSRPTAKTNLFAVKFLKRAEASETIFRAALSADELGEGIKIEYDGGFSLVRTSEFAGILLI